MILAAITFLLLVCYCLIFFIYRSGWRQLELFSNHQLQEKIKVSIIIAARNEENNIGHLLSGIQRQTYPSTLIEVIVVDDHSSDNTVAFVKNFPFAKLICLEADVINSYKKKALETGIAAASGQLVITTDADCMVTEKWIETIVAFYLEKKPAFISAPVGYVSKKNLLGIFQTLDFMMLQGITAAAVQMKIHALGNGANLAYERNVFYEVGGFSGVDHLASGDDLLLMQKISSKYPSRIGYLFSEDAIVKTHPAFTWNDFFNQRIRWASKTTAYTDWKLKLVMMMVFLFNTSLLFFFIFGFWVNNLWLAALVFVIIKTTVELIFLFPVSRFFKQSGLLRWFLFLQPLHIIYTVISGSLASFGSYNWKGRRVK